ncbi:Bacteriophage Mu Gam like protein [Caloramator quimbayensis]|uniref:Bacteriophage Mu Gam like protein n=2 Tax=Caloramator quimbayensis TaxID=1147123 RepID=A0A1T4YHV2_9CLOT|nr:Bacteriophage Mu Gam like protein [Caloramator quimbayensis]
MDAFKIADEFLPEEEAKQEGFIVDNDLKADWCIEKIKEAHAEYNRYEMVIKAKIEQLNAALKKAQEKRDSEENFFKYKLYKYFKTVKTKDTKTQKVYSLPSGKLIEKMQQPEYIKDEEKLLEWAEKNCPENIKIKKSVDWAILKKNIEMINGLAINKNTGEVIEGITIQEREPKFIVEVE